VNAKPWVATLIAGMLLPVFPAIGFGLNYLTPSAPIVQILYPLPLVFAMPAILFGGAWGHAAAILVIPLPSLLFWGWSVQLFRGEATLPLRSVLLLLALAILSIVYFVASWNFGVQWQGYPHLVSVTLLNALALVALWWLLRAARSKPLFRRSLTFHWALFAWLAWLAFPWLGEGL
jgi:hypothetical protein